MAKPSKQDPTGQAKNRRTGTAALRKRFTKAESSVKAMFRRIPRTRRQLAPLTNRNREPAAELAVAAVATLYRQAAVQRLPVSLEDVTQALTANRAVIPVYDYQISLAELEQLNEAIRATVAADVVETQFARMPPNWWWQSVVEAPYRQGTAQEVVEFNQLVTRELVRIRKAGGNPRAGLQRLEVGAVLMSDEYQQALQKVYVRNFNNIKTLSDRTADQVVQVINAGINAGNTPTEIAGMISGRFDVARSSSERTAVTEVNAAYNDARLDATDVAGKITGLRAGVLHLSALIPTTRDGHAARHGNAYTTAQQRKWWDEGANRIRCHCSTRSALIDAQGKVIDVELQEEIKAERNFFEPEEPPPAPPTPAAPKRRRRPRRAPSEEQFTSPDAFRADMVQRFDGPVNLNINKNGEKIAPQVMTTFAALARDYVTENIELKTFSVSNTSGSGKRINVLERGHVATFFDNSKDFFIHSGNPRRQTAPSRIWAVGEDLDTTVTHEFAHLLYITRRPSSAAMKQDLDVFLNSDTYRQYSELKRGYQAEKSATTARLAAEYGRRYREGEFPTKDAANDALGAAIEQNMIGWLDAAEHKDLFISEYAFSSLDETLAEGFAAYKLKKQHGAVAAEIGRLYDKHFKRVE